MLEKLFTHTKNSCIYLSLYFILYLSFSMGMLYFNILKINFKKKLKIDSSKSTLCTNKVRVIQFCPNCVNFLPENVHVFIILFTEARKRKVIFYDK